MEMQKNARLTPRQRAGRQRYFGVAVAFLAGVSALALPSLGQAAPVNQLLSLMIVSDMLVARCPDSYRARFSETDFERFQGNFARLEQMLIDLAVQLDPQLGRDRAAREIAATVERRRDKFASNLEALGCDADNISPYIERFAFFAAADFDERFAGDIFPGHPFDRRRPLQVSSTGAESYAYDGMRETAIGIIRTKQYAVEPCADFDVLEVVLVSRREVESANRPVFIAGPVEYTETWRVFCHGAVSEHRIAFSQTSQGGSDAYFVE